MSHIESKVKLADLTDIKTVEDLRHYFHDLMFSQGWTVNDLIVAFNNQIESQNHKPIHKKSLKNALAGKKQFRNVAYELEQFLLSNKGPLYSQTSQSNIPN